MDRSIAALTEEYVRERAHVQACLRAGLLNYSALARMVAQDIKRPDAAEAILIAARRLRERLSKQEGNEVRVRSVLRRSEFVVRNRMCVLIVGRSAGAQRIDAAQAAVRKEGGVAYVIEGSDHWTIVAQEQHAERFSAVRSHLIKRTDGVALVMLKSPKEIERVPGVVAYLTALFAQNGVNIVELLSCWTDTLFVIDSKDVPRAMGFLQF